MIVNSEIDLNRLSYGFEFVLESEKIPSIPTT